jgi:uncharacterized membrane protein YjjB (DUF3815 family)
MSDDPKLDPAAPGLPTMDTTNASETVGSVIAHHFKTHTLAYLTAIVLFLSANLGAVYENFYNLPKAEMSGYGWWQVAALVAKSLNAGFIAVLGYLMRSPLPEKPKV